jgi:hypothetical protein
MSNHSGTGPVRQVSPPKAEIQSGNQVRQEENHVHHSHDDFLFLFLLLAVEPPFDEGWVALVEVKRKDKPWNEPNGEISPALPKPQRACREEQQDRHEEHPYDDS